MNFIFIFATGVAIGITGAMIPGPLTLFMVSETLRGDRFVGFKATLGHIVSELALVGVILLGFHKFLAYKPFLFGISIIGGLGLIGMGILLLVKSRRMKLTNLKSDSRFNKGLIAGGFFFSMVSPGFFIWWATIGVSTIINALLSGILGVLVLMLGHWFADMIWHSFLSFMVDKGRPYLSDSSYRNILRFFSLTLIILVFVFLPLK